MAFCTGCGKEVPAGAMACPACGQGAAGVAPVSASATTGGMTDNMVAALAYFTFIPAIIFLVLEPYCKNKALRFHCFQCLFFNGGLVLVYIALTVLGMVPFMKLLTIPIWFVVWLGSIIVWLILTLKAYQGQKFKLPFVGDLAEQQANAG
jgi:uncharacterized membrane protein